MDLTSLDNQLSASRPLMFGTEGTGVVLGRGWHPAEADAAWTNGPFAELTLSVDRDLGSYVLSIECSALIMPGTTPSQLLIFVNGKLCATEMLHDWQTVDVIVNDAAAIAELVIWVPAIRSPNEVDPTCYDFRRLGVHVKSIRLAASPGL